MTKINLGIIGAGWRALFFVRIVKAFPEMFHCAGVVVRNAEKRQAFAKKWNLPTFSSVDEMADATDLDYVIVSTSENEKVIVEVAKLGLPCLTETPPARDLDGLLRLYDTLGTIGGRTQVAEQYHLRPHHQAQTKVIQSGRIGTVSQVQLSIAHGFHGISMIRHFLGLGYQNAAISGTSFSSPLTKGPDRSGPPTEESTIQSDQVHAWFHFENDKFAVMDFTNNQYRAWIRAERALIRGNQGEISGNHVSYLKSFDEPMAFEIERVTNGQEEDSKPSCFIGYRAEGEWLYRTPFSRPILMDDEIAMAHCMVKMMDFVKSGTNFYSVAEASQDVYLSLLYEQAIKENRVIESKTQIWAEQIT